MSPTGPTTRLVGAGARATSPPSNALSPRSRRSGGPRGRRGRDRAGAAGDRRAQLVSGQRGEQRKLVSVLFADLVDFNVLSRQLDPEDTRSVVTARFARWQAAIEAHGGVVEKFIGDAVMAVFGLRRPTRTTPNGRSAPVWP